MKPRTPKTEPNLPTLEPRISAFKKKGNTAKQDERRRGRKLAAILAPLKRVLQRGNGRE